MELLIVEGRDGKAPLVHSIVNLLPKDDCVIMDKIDTAYDWYERNSNFFNFGRVIDHDEVIGHMRSSMRFYIQDKPKTAVLMVHCPPEYIERYVNAFKEMDYPWERLILTVQNNDINFIRTRNEV